MRAEVPWRSHEIYFMSEEYTQSRIPNRAKVLEVLFLYTLHEMDGQSQEAPAHLFEDMSPEMIRIYLEQERQEKAEDEAFRERERVWHARYWEEFHNAVSDR